MAAKNKLGGFFSRILVAPSCGPSLPAVLVRLSNFLHNILPWFQGCFRRVFQIVEIMDLSRWMILRHVEAVIIDERGLDERPHSLSKPKRNKLPFDHPQESQVRMILSRIERWDRGGDVVGSELDPLPV